MDAPSDELSRRIKQVQAQIEQLNQEVAAMAAQQEREAREKEAKEAVVAQNPGESLENAVLRYAVACGAVDVQIALLRAQSTFGSGGTSGAEGALSQAQSEVLRNLSDSLEEQSAASAILRGLARTIRQGRG